MIEKENFLHRQVHPSWVQEGRPTSQAFGPTPKDNGFLSVYDGNQMSAETSFGHYTLVQKLVAEGTVTVTSAEVEAIGLPWLIDGKPFPQHGVIDFNALTTAGKIKAKAQALAEKARARGWTFKP